VQYEQCFGYDYFDVVSQVLSYDWGMVAERSTTVVVSLFTDSKDWLNDFSDSICKPRILKK